jgi:hypothetical protein
MTYSLDNAIEQFIREKGDEVIQIQIMERNTNGRGAFFVTFNDKANVDAYYIPFHDKKFPQQFMPYYRERIDNPHLDSILFFVFFYEDKQQFLELNIDPNAKQESDTSQQESIEEL